MSAPSQTRTNLRRLALRLVAGALTKRGPTAGPAQRIALLRPDHLGDVVLATPAIARLRDALPDADLTVIVGPWSLPVATAIPDVRVETIPFPGFQRGPKPSLLAPYRLLWREAARMRGRFDSAVVLRFDHWWGALLSAVAGVPRIVGYDQPDVAPFLTRAVPYRAGRHEAIQNATLIDALLDDLGFAPPAPPVGAPRLSFPPAPLPVGVCSPYLVLHPGAGAPVKRWRVAAFARVGEQARGHGVGVVVTGSEGERALVEEVCAATGGVAVIGAAMPVLASVLAQSLVTIGPDSGVLHIASAVGAPTIRLFGPVDHRTFGPFVDDTAEVIVSTLPCVPCNRLDYTENELAAHPCIRDVPAEAVMAAVERQLARRC